MTSYNSFNGSRIDLAPQTPDVSHNKESKNPINWQDLTVNFDPLSAQMFKFQKSVEQSSASLCEKLYLRDLLYCAISPHFTGCGLYIVGSTLNGFGSKHSDMDLCLMISKEQLDQRTKAVGILEAVMGHLKEVPLINTLQVIPAKVPILRATFNAPFENIIVDLNANNAVAIRNTHLLYHYSGYDWRVRPLVHVIKAWAKKCGINNANRSSLTSYSLVLMVISYLQCGVNPRILPSLQITHQHRFSADVDVCSFDIRKPLEKPHYWPKNNMTLCELLGGFFHYYAFNFNFNTSAISVRSGGVLNRSEVVSQHTGSELAQWRCICIEEPFALSNAAHSVYDERTFDYIKESFKNAYYIFCQSGSLKDLLDLGTENIQ